MNRNNLQQYFAELIGTFFLVFFGCGSMVLAETMAGYEGGFVPVVWGGAVSIMIYAVGHISGAHFNPAVTIAFWAIKKFPSSKVPGYIAFQFVGAILASLSHFFIWGGDHGFGSTHVSISLAGGLFTEFLLSFVLMFVIVAVATDSRAVGELAGIAIGSTVALCAFVGGPLTNASMNPARSFGPALLNGDFSNLYLYFLAPIAGTVIGALAYEKIRCLKEESDSEHGCC